MKLLADLLDQVDEVSLEAVISGLRLVILGVHHKRWILAGGRRRTSGLNNNYIVYGFKVKISRLWSRDIRTKDILLLT